MIPEIEKKVFEKISFTSKFLKIRNKFIDDGLDTPIFKKSDIIRVFSDLGL
jgi:hypothetical protein